MLLIVRRFLMLTGILLTLAPALARAQGSQEITIWSCRDKDGHTYVTNLREDTTGKDCRVVQQTRVQVVPAQANPSKPASRTSPGAFPKEDAQQRASAKERQKDILEGELKKEQELLDGARKDLAEQEAVRYGDEHNYARVLERLQKYKDAVELHQKNVESLNRELTNLYR
jgi:hypothetical protein